jgi:alpha-galactosidase
MPKIALLGAGSGVFSLSLIRDLCLTPNLAGNVVTFMDVDESRLEGAFSLCRRFADEVGIRLTLERTTDRRAALQGADFVVNTALGAGHQRLNAGWEIGRQLGYRIGGSLHIMHDEAFWVNFYQYRLFEAFIQDILEICPNAYYLQVANPVFAGLTLLGRKYPQARIVGLCHGYHGVYHLAHELGLDPARLSFEIPGVNHFVFLTGLYSEGKNVLPMIDEWIEQKAPAYWKACGDSDDLGPKPVDVYHRLGLFPIGDTAAPGGGAWPFWYHTDDETEKHWKEDPWSWYQGHFSRTTQKVEDVKRICEDTSVKVTDYFQLQKSGEAIIDLIESIACDIPRPLVVNLPNTHAYVPGIPKDVAVEIQALVSARGIQGICSKGLPRHILARIFHDRIGPMEMELAAYEQGSYELLLQLVLMDPFTKSIDQAKALLDGILALPYHEEMRRHYVKEETKTA